MSSIESPKPPCPVCHQADQVKTTQAAYDSGVARCAPPDMPVRNVSMVKYMLISGILIGVFIFMIIVFIGSEANLNFYLQLTLVSLTLITIVAGLVTSYMAFQKVVQGDAEATLQFPAWDKATAAWKCLYYCARNDVVFNPKTNNVVSNEELATLRTVDDDKAVQVASTIAG